MRILPSQPSSDDGDREPASRYVLLSSGASSRENIGTDEGEGESGPKLDPLGLLRRHWMLLVLLMTLGASAGFVSVVLSSPLYRTHLLLEVQGVNEALAKNSMDAVPFDSTEIGIQTQINILRSGSFLRRGADRLQSESVPLAPTGRDLFSRLRQRVNPATQDPIEHGKKGLNLALATFDARPVNRTRLIELSCESTSPDVAAQFLNSMAAEFLDDTVRSRTQTSQKTGEWLLAQIEETKSKLQEAEERQRDFVQASGNLFAGQDNTLDDTKLSQLKLELAKIQAQRIARQTRHELVLKSAPETLAEVLDDGNLRGYQQQLGTLEREKASLEVTLTPKHEKVRKLDAQIVHLKKSYQEQVAAITTRIKDDYQSALRHEKLLTSAYAAQSQRVGSEAGQAARNNALKREVEMLRQMYQTLLMQSNQAGISSSVPVNPVRIVEPAAVPEVPYKPVPLLNISFGSIFGFALCAGIVFMRQWADRSIHSPGMTRRMLNAPELGVIPNLQLGASSRSPLAKLTKLLPGASPLNGNGYHEHPEAALESLKSAPAFVTESFRGTLASILRHQTGGKAAKTILITSPGPAEGKTTVVQHLGIALAETGRKVLLVDADFRRPMLHHRFGLPNEWSLVDLLSENTPVKEYSDDKLGLSTGFPGLSIFPNRAEQENVAKVLYSPRLRAIFEVLIERYDMVLVDAPPILHLADARIVAPLTDAVILVLRSGVTNREAMLEACQRIQEDGLFLLGTVLTDCKSNSSRSLNYYYNYVNDQSQ